MTTGPMVRLAVVPTAFEAQLLAARLGSEGLLWQLRGNLGGPYPVGPVEVLVDPADLSVACELLLVDEVELALHDADLELAAAPEGRARPPRWARRGVHALVLGSLVASVTGLARLVEQAG